MSIKIISFGVLLLCGCVETQMYRYRETVRDCPPAVIEAFEGHTSVPKTSIWCVTGEFFQTRTTSFLIDYVKNGEERHLVISELGLIVQEGMGASEPGRYFCRQIENTSLADSEGTEGTEERSVSAINGGADRCRPSIINSSSSADSSEHPD